MNRFRDFVGVFVLAGSLLFVFQEAKAQRAQGVEVGNNIAFIKAAAQAPYVIERLGAPDIQTTIWKGEGGDWALEEHVAEMERAIRRCDETGLADAKRKALGYLLNVTAYALHPALEIAHLVYAVRMRCGQRVYEASQGWFAGLDVRDVFKYFQPYIRQAKWRQRTQTPPPAASTTTEDRRTGFVMPGNAGTFRAVTFTAAGGAVSRNANATISRLAREVGNTKMHDVSNVKQNDVGATGEVRVRIPFGAAPSEPQVSPFCRFIEETARGGLITGCGSSLDMGYRFTGVDGSSAGAGPQLPNLSFPGLGVQGTAGNNSNSGGYFITNQPHTFGYSYEFNQHLFDTTFDVVGFNAGPNTIIRPFVGARGMFTEVNDSFATNVTFPNGFPVDALHTTNTDMFSGGLFAGLNVFYAVPGGPSIVILGARGGFDVNRAESDVAFSIQTPNFFDLQRITVKDTAVTPYVRAEAGIATNILGANVQSTIFVEHGGAFPNVQIPGGGPRPYIDFTNETSFGGKLKVTFTNAPTPRDRVFFTNTR